MERAKRIAWMLAIAATVVGSAAGLTGCNTIEGAGEDIERGGERIQDAADNE